MADLLALPERVCSYGSAADLEDSRLESGQWVFWEDRVDLVMNGRYNEIRPLHVELSPTYLCNFACPWCSCRTARTDWAGDDVFTHPLATESTVMSEARLAHTIDHLAEYKVGIMWVGGEPTMSRALYPAVRLANDAGLQQCLFTNGSLLTEPRTRQLLEGGLIFIRVSLDAVDPHVHQVHHGYRPDRPYAAKVLSQLESLLRMRNGMGSSTMIGVSVVVDECNLSDVANVAAYIRDLSSSVGGRPIDYLIVRPTHQFYAAQMDLTTTTVSALWRLVDASGEVRAILKESGTDVVAPTSSFAEAAPAAGRELSQEPVDLQGRQGTGLACLAAGWFGEVTARGDYVACSDRYGNPDYFIGDIAANSIDALWRGAKRASVLEFAKNTSCFETRCPRNGRGYWLNSIFHDIEGYRRRDDLGSVRQWIEGLRTVLPRPSHPFFL